MFLIRDVITSECYDSLFWPAGFIKSVINHQIITEQFAVVFQCIHCITKPKDGES